MIRPFYHLAFGAAVVGVLACGGSTTAPDIATTTFASSLNVHLSAMTKTSDGLYYQDSVIGTGAVVAPGDSISATYVGWLANGTSFDANTNLPFRLGTLIAGWNEGIPGM